MRTEALSFLSIFMAALASSCAINIFILIGNNPIKTVVAKGLPGSSSISIRLDDARISAVVISGGGGAVPRAGAGAWPRPCPGF
jgi:hypothetical protein